MNTISTLEKLCAPVLTLVCNYWQLADLGKEPNKEKFQHDVEELLREAKEESKKDEELAKEYARIERPLVFFIDYTVKEGKFPFRQEWRELARAYNELSGDEKFFDLLSAALDDPVQKDTVVLYDVMLGLGFDGDRRSDPSYIENCMKRCASKINDSFDIRNETIVSSIEKERAAGKKKRRSTPPLLTAIVLAGIGAFLCFMINLGSFLNVTERFRQVLAKTAEDAVPQSAGVLYDFPERQQNLNEENTAPKSVFQVNPDQRNSKTQLK
ncbi:MAG: DotU family type IV/VI secretion system protein [Spirochaetaceae bacterium]|nr:DotU family type IV/VI secretion system protein [Spirochaetaceae bacterium]